MNILQILYITKCSIQFLIDENIIIYFKNNFERTNFFPFFYLYTKTNTNNLKIIPNNYDSERMKQKYKKELKEANKFFKQINIKPMKLNYVKPNDNFFELKHFSSIYVFTK